MRNDSVKKLVLSGLMIALVFLATVFLKVDTVLGPFNLGDAIIIVAAVFLGKGSGFIAGSIGSAIADIYSGWGIYAPITFLVKGIEGLVVGAIAHNDKKSTGYIVKVIAILTGAIIMVGGYFLAEAFVLGYFSKEFGWVRAVQGLSVNVPQGIACSIVGYILITLLERSKALKQSLGKA